MEPSAAAALTAARWMRLENGNSLDICDRVIPDDIP